MKKYIIWVNSFFFILTWQLAAQTTLPEKSYVQPLQDVFQTDLVYPQKQHEMQVTMAPMYQKLKANSLLQIPLIIEYGLTSSWQVGFEWPPYQQLSINSATPVKGPGDLHIGSKYSFMNIKNSNFHSAIGLEVTVPLGNEKDELGEGLWSYEPYALFAFDLPSLNCSQIFAQVAIELMQKNKNVYKETVWEETENHELMLSGGFFIPLKPFIFSSEISWFASYWGNEMSTQLYLTPGITKSMPGGWEIGVGVPVCINKHSANFRVITLMTYEINFTTD